MMADAAMPQHVSLHCLWIHIPFTYHLGCPFLPHPRHLHPIMLSLGPLFQITSFLSPLIRLLLPSLVHSLHLASHLALPLMPLLALETVSRTLPIHFSYGRSNRCKRVKDYRFRKKGILSTTYTPLHHINLTQNKDKKSGDCRRHVEGCERRCHVEKHPIYPRC